MADEPTLAAALEGLREDLECAWRSGEGHKVRFRTSEVTLKLETVAHFDKDAGGGVHFYVLSAGAKVESGHEWTQTLTLTLQPHLADEDLDVLDVSAPRPGPKTHEADRNSAD